MKKFAVAMLLVAGLALAGCGSGNHSGNVNGNWTAALTDSSNGQVFAFSTSLVATSGGSSLTVSNFSFTSNTACFVSGETESATFVLSGNFNGNVTGSFQFNVISGNPAGNTLTLTGTANGNSITGTWVLSGGTASCTGNGNFTMAKV